MQVTIFKNILETKTPFHVPIDKIIDRIGQGQSKDLVEKIRNCTDKSQRTELKKQLPSICFSGKFSQRANNSCLEHSGLVCLDFDHLDKPDEFKKALKNDKYVMLAFISPSGDGLKVIVKIPTSIENHAASCRALKDYFKNEKLDNFEDVARVCFESYDTEIYINLQSEIFTDLIHQKIVETRQIEKQINSNEIFEKLKVWIEKYENYSDGNKHKFLVKFAGACNRFGIDEQETNYLLITYYQNSASFVKTSDIEKIVSKVYANYRNQFNTSFFEITGIAIERQTSKRITDNFFQSYTDEVKQNELIERVFLESKLDWNKEYKQPDFILKIKYGTKLAKICSLGNFSALTGKSKSRKSFARLFFEASFLGNKPIQDKIYANLPADKRNIIYFDTEQGISNVFNSAFRAVKMAEVSDISNYQVFALRNYSYSERCFIIENIISNTQNLGVVFIDGIADLAYGNNDEKEANRVIQLLMTWSATYNIHICVIIHQPKGSDWATGHLGSGIEKKAESVINIKKENTYSIFESRQLRNSEDFLPFPFLINADGLPEIITDETIVNDIFDTDI